MSYKLGFLAGAAAGYVLGARAGRSAYEGIKSTSAKAWNSKPVQSAVSSAVSDAADAVKAKAPAATHGLVDKAAAAIAPESTTTTGTTSTSATPVQPQGATAVDAPKGPALS